ncbi:hypothetical protein [Nonomuraea salmonea]|uniref:hypothetical protein n=1 Tax=Nonomuraea salmonea TaxID=46181 RepID=UPI002FEC884A
MSDFSEFRERGRAALLAGEATHDVPMVEGGARWGAAVVLRPAGEVAGRLTDLAATVHAPGHWVHGGPALHVTLRSLEPYRSVIPEDDPLRRAYAAALAEAADGLPPAWVYLAGVAPHQGGVLVGGRIPWTRRWRRCASASPGAWSRGACATWSTAGSATAGTSAWSTSPRP